MYGIAIKPTRIRLGITTPAIQGSKYTSISCRPKKYHGAFAGLGDSVGLAGSSIGAASPIDQTSKKAEAIINDISST